MENLFQASFPQILEDNENVYNQTMDLIRTCADEKGIEFDGYFNQRWIDSADTIINFDEEYFENQDRRDLYVFLSALVDEEIFSFLNYLFLAVRKSPVSKEEIHIEIEKVKSKGVKF